jgi:hypothetical protein
MVYGTTTHTGLFTLRFIPTPSFRHIFAALVALTSEAMLRKALIRAVKTSPTARKVYVPYFFEFV